MRHKGGPHSSGLPQSLHQPSPGDTQLLPQPSLALVYTNHLFLKTAPWPPEGKWNSGQFPDLYFELFEVHLWWYNVHPVCPPCLGVQFSKCWPAHIVTHYHRSPHREGFQFTKKSPSMLGLWKPRIWSLSFYFCLFQKRWNIEMSHVTEMGSYSM